MRRQFLTLVTLVTLTVLPGVAAATPTDYTVNSGGSLSIIASGTSNAATASRNISLGIGSFTYDSATGRVTNFRLFASDNQGLMASGEFSARSFSQQNSTAPNRLVISNPFLTLTFNFTASPVVAAPNPGGVSPVPEPTAALLFASGVGVVGFVGARRRNA